MKDSERYLRWARQSIDDAAAAARRHDVEDMERAVNDIELWQWKAEQAAERERRRGW
jgi:hypothetical protein